MAPVATCLYLIFFISASYVAGTSESQQLSSEQESSTWVWLGPVLGAVGTIISAVIGTLTCHHPAG